MMHAKAARRLVGHSCLDRGGETRAGLPNVLRTEGNSWSLRSDVLTLGYGFYEINLLRCQTSAAVLDWIIQISHKGWGDKVIADLIRALRLLLDPQATLCSDEIEQGPVDWETELRSRQ